MEYRNLYLTLFNAVTEAIRHLEKQDPVTAWEILLRAQLRTEALYLEQEEENTP